MANFYGPKMRDIRNNETILSLSQKAECAVNDFIQEGIRCMEESGQFTPTEIGDIMMQWVNATIRATMYDAIPNEQYPQYREIDSAINGFLIKGNYYYLFDIDNVIQIFGEDKNIRVEPAQIVARNGLVDIRLKDPNITLYFELRDNYKEHHLKYELYKILQNLW